MRKIELLLERIYEDRICDQFDHVMPIVGDEGVGKSTLILELMIIWQDIKDQDHDADKILDSFVYDREGLKDTLASSERRSVIAVPDAARVLHKKETMKSEQVELEKDFFDVRTKEFLILLGFQDWSSIPSFLQKRRAKNALFIPRRGVVRGYNRQSLDDRVDGDSWPGSDLTESFPSLEGTEIWDRYQELDRQKKDERMHGNEEEEEERELSAKEIIEEIEQNGVRDFVSINPGNKQPYIDPDLIEFEFGVSARKAKKIKKVLARDYDASVVEGAA